MINLNYRVADGVKLTQVMEAIESATGIWVGGSENIINGYLSMSGQDLKVSLYDGDAPQESGPDVIALAELAENPQNVINSINAALAGLLA